MKIFPIILGSDENAYGVCRLFNEEYGFKPLMLCTRRLVPSFDTSIAEVRQIQDFDNTEIFVSELKKALAETKKDDANTVVIPCSDYYAALVIKNYEKFGGMIANKFISPSLLDTLDTKDKFYSLCEKFGMDYPLTVVCTPSEAIEKYKTPPFSLPMVIKPENSNATEYLHLSFEGKKKVYFVNTPEEYTDIISKLANASYSGKLIMQEFIPGGDDSMRVINTYSDNNGKVRFMSLGQPILEEYAPNMVGNYAAIITRNDAEIYDKIKDFLEKIGYVGFANFDMKYDSRRKKYMLFEINPRQGRSSFFVYAGGINMMKILVSSLENNGDGVVLGENTALWSAVPKYIIKHYTENAELKNEALELWKTKGVTRNLFNKKEKSLKRKLKILRYYFASIGVYKKYYFKKQG